MTARNLPGIPHDRQYRLPSVELTVREREVAGLLAQGLRPKAIAARLQLHKNTVSNYIERGRKRLGLYNRYQLADFARSQGWS